MKPTVLTLFISLAIGLVVHAQTPSASQVSPSATNEQSSPVLTRNPHQPGPEDIIQSRLKKLEVDAPVTYRTNGNLVFCTIRCGNLDQRNAVYDGFSNLSKYGLTATRNPPTVTVVLVLDAAKYFNDQQNRKLVSKLQSAETNLVGHVVQKTADGLIVALSDSEMVLLTDPPKLNQGDPVKVTAFRIGDYDVTDSNGVPKVIRKFTCDLAAATDHFTPMASSEAKTETQKHADVSE